MNLKKHLLKKLKKMTLDEIAEIMISSNPLLKEKLFMEVMGFEHNTDVTGFDGFNPKSEKYVELKTTAANLQIKRGKLGTSGVKYGSPSHTIYDKKYLENEETYCAGFAGSEVLFYVKFNFKDIEERYLNAILRGASNCTIGYQQLLTIDNALIYVRPDLHKFEEFVTPELYKKLTDKTDKRLFSSHKKYKISFKEKNVNVLHHE